jgi:hypothetical protein
MDEECIDYEEDWIGTTYAFLNDEDFISMQQIKHNECSLASNPSNN